MFPFSATFRFSNKCSQILINSKRFSRKVVHKRKPTWMPMAPSKVFVIKEKPVVPEDERLQIEALEHYYETFRNSAKHYFEKTCYLPSITSGGLSEHQVQEELASQRQLLLENEEENKRVAALREEMSALHNKLTEEALLEQNQKLTEESEAIIRDFDEKVKQEIKRSETYITKANIKEAIEAALLNPVSYEYAVDVHGNVHYDERLHPYALKPNAIPETSSTTKEFECFDPSKPVKFEKKVVY